MTTGCTCGTPGCPGLAHEPGGKCRDCEIDAMPPASRRLARFIDRVFNGPRREIERGEL